MAYNYPYGAVPQQGYRAQVNPMGYASPVAQANPFSALVLAHGMRSAFSGSSSSSDPDVSVVTYDSYMGEKDFSTETLSIAPEDIGTFGKPLGLKFKDCHVLIPLPSKKAVCNAVNNQISAVKSDASDKEKKELGKLISIEMAKEFYAKQCAHGSALDPGRCNPFMPDAGNKIGTMGGSIRKFFGDP